jgi:metal-responsive CopG/Arc/MetJ family transcriptional regulator
MPDEPDNTRITIPVPRDLLDRVDEHRFSRRIASRAAAIRELLEVALTVKTKEKSK